MPIEITTLPEFGPAMAKFQLDKAQATQAGDETALLRANLEWEQARAAMTQRAYEAEALQQSLASTRARIKAENPDVPEAIYAGDDLVQAEASAKSVQALLSSQKAPTTTGSGETQSWGPSGGSAGAPGVTPPMPTDDASRRLEMNRLSKTVITRGRMAMEENDRLQQLSIQEPIGRFMQRLGIQE